MGGNKLHASMTVVTVVTVKLVVVDVVAVVVSVWQNVPTKPDTHSHTTSGPEGPSPDAIRSWNPDPSSPSIVSASFVVEHSPSFWHGFGEHASVAVVVVVPVVVVVVVAVTEVDLDVVVVADV